MSKQTKPTQNVTSKKSNFLSQAAQKLVFALAALSFAVPQNASTRTITADMVSAPAMYKLSLVGIKRVLVISPHPDDETIALGGLIQMALANGSEVRVVIVTNGDGQFGAPALFGMKGFVTPAGYISMGVQRQSESTAALMRLGVSLENIIFLGYPDRGIGPMLEKNWEDTNPFTAPFTRKAASPYSKVYNPQSAYAGENLFSDLVSLIEDYQPDLIVCSHPSDTHSDHSAVSRFTTLAVGSIQAEDPSFQPQVWAYLVHYGEYPKSETGDKNQQFLPPSDLTENNTWGYLDLTAAQETTKTAAIKDYSTQNVLLANFLPEFVRNNEIYMTLSTAG